MPELRKSAAVWKGWTKLETGCLQMSGYKQEMLECSVSSGWWSREFS